MVPLHIQYNRDSSEFVILFFACVFDNVLSEGTKNCECIINEEARGDA